MMISELPFMSQSILCIRNRMNESKVKLDSENDSNVAKGHHEKFVEVDTLHKGCLEECRSDISTKFGIQM